MISEGHGGRMRRAPQLAAPALIAVALAFGAPRGAAQEAGAEPPIEVGLEEQVEVRLVLVDFLALDTHERTVADLSAGELTLLVDGRETEIASLDRNCSGGRLDEPRAGSGPGPAAVEPPPQPRQIVLVFDYYHMTDVAETYDRVRDTLDRWAQPGDRHMVVSLSNIVRVESEWSDDLDEVRGTLSRMRADPGLYAGNHSTLTEWPFFDRIQMLFDLMEHVPGRKTLVLFSGPFAGDGFYHDMAYRQLSAMATIARASVYPVDTGGLRTLVDPDVTRLGGPASLRRLANETGGRMTADTNDIGLAYARAQRDLSCGYTLGFHDRRPRPDDRRRLTIRAARRGVRIVYPEFYVIRSDDEKRRSLARTAAMAPAAFDSERMRAELFLLGPKSVRRWNALLAVELRLEPDEHLPEGGEWIVRGLLRKPNGTVVRSFRRRMAATSTDSARRLALYEEISVAPGSYVVSAVVSGPASVTPRTATRPAEVAAVPRDAAFLVGPLLGRRPAPDARGAFEPLLTAEATQGEALESRTLVCVSGDDGPSGVARVSREVLASGGGPVEPAQPFERLAAPLEGDGRVRCHELFDRVETAALAPGRYELVASAQAGERVAGRGSAPFTILPARGRVPK